MNKAIQRVEDFEVVAQRKKEAVQMSPSVSLADMERMAEAFAKCGLFGFNTKEQALALMLISHAEGRHPALAARDYDIIQGKPSKKTEAMARDFMSGGGKIKWIEGPTDKGGKAEFSHPSGGTVVIDWDVKRAQQAGLFNKNTWKTYPRAMFRSRIISEGIRAVGPFATSGMYVPEEVADFGPAPKPAKNVTPKKTTKKAPPPDKLIEEKEIKEVVDDLKGSAFELTPLRVKLREKIDFIIKATGKAEIYTWKTVTELPALELPKELNLLNKGQLENALRRAEKIIKQTMKGEEE